MTSPILARTLGPSGRGELAAILVVLGLAPMIGDIGLYVFVTRERARAARPLGLVLGSTVPLAMAAALVGVAAAVPIANALGRGRKTVELFIEIGLVALPISVFVQTLVGVVVGAQRWRVVITSRLMGVGGTTLAIVVLSVAGRLTVTTAAIAYLGLGVVSTLPYLVGLRGSRPWRFERGVAREGLAFGFKSWLFSLAGQANGKLDQLLMAALVSSRQLGLYALAATLATASTSLVSAVNTALLPRVAGGDPALVTRACRVTFLIVGVYAVGLGLACPVLLPLVFGSAFSGSVPMLVVLLVGSLLLVPSQVLCAAAIAAGDPGTAARSQLVGLAVTVPGLVVALPVAGGVGAAVVSAMSYGASFAVLWGSARRRFDLSLRQILWVTVADVRWLHARVRRAPAPAIGVGQ